MRNQIIAATGLLFISLTLHAFANEQEIIAQEQALGSEAESVLAFVEKSESNSKVDAAHTQRHALNTLFSDPSARLKDGLKLEHTMLWLMEPLDDEGVDRDPASSKKRGTASQSPLPSGVSDGFEMRVRINKQISKFWVIKKGDDFNLLFINSSGSRAAVGLTEDHFKQLHTHVRGIASVSANIKKCPEARMQMRVVTNNKQEKAMQACIEGKDKSSTSMRMIGNLLSSFVR